MKNASKIRKVLNDNLKAFFRRLQMFESFLFSSRDVCSFCLRFLSFALRTLCSRFFELIFNSIFSPTQELWSKLSRSHLEKLKINFRSKNSRQRVLKVLKARRIECSIKRRKCRLGSDKNLFAIGFVLFLGAHRSSSVRTCLQNSTSVDFNDDGREF